MSITHNYLRKIHSYYSAMQFYMIFFSEIVTKEKKLWHV